MLLDVIIEDDTLTIEIQNPFRLDMNSIMEKIDAFAASKKINLKNIDIKNLLPEMTRGIAGCESGCPANALCLVEQGFRNFKLSYIEGGILAASADTGTGKTLQLKMFPDF